MLASFRTRAALAAAVLSLAACGQETALPTTLDPAEVTADVEVTQAAFENAQTSALSDLGFAIDDALVSFGGLPASMASIVAAGPTTPSDKRSAGRMLDRVEAFSATEPMSAIPAAVLGQTLVWNLVSLSYELSDPAISGAPANGVRFRLYQTDAVTGLPADPLVVLGYADLSREGTSNNPAARLAVYTTAGIKLLEYVAIVGGTPSVPNFRVDGTAGVGPNFATFSLTVGVNLTNGTVTAVWSTAVPARSISTRTTLGIGQSSFTLTGVIQRGLSKVELAGTLDYQTGGQVTVKVGNRVFATMTVSAAGESSGFVNAAGNPLTPEEAATLAAIFDWFDDTWDWYEALLDPVYTVLDVPLS